MVPNMPTRSHRDGLAAEGGRVNVSPTATSMCAALHEVVREGTLHTFPFNRRDIPSDGIYALFESGESSHGGNRIVRIGTHTGDGQLPSRLLQHFVQENKDRSIFRKNIGRALLMKADDAYLAEWEIDRTSRLARERFGPEHDLGKRASIEADVTRHLQTNMSFVVFSVPDKAERLRLESRMISTLSICRECLPSATWLGSASPKDRIRQTGLWLVNELFKEPLTDGDLRLLAAARL
jgi:hypothetical protein